MLQPIPIPANALHVELQSPALNLARDANERVTEFTRRHQPTIPNFVVCDFALVDAGLAWIGDQGLSCGDRFCEWGCGFGVVAMLAALRDWQSCGIEVEPVLVDEARRLAEDHDIEADFSVGSFIPEGGEDLLEFFEDINHIDTDCPSGYDDLDFGIEDFDLFFAFPWPGEHRYWESVFDHFAADGAMLLTYHGIESLKLQRKIG